MSNQKAEPFIELKVDLINSIWRYTNQTPSHTLHSHYTHPPEENNPEFVLWLKPNTEPEVDWAADENQAFFVCCRVLYDHNQTGIFMGFSQRQPGQDIQHNLPSAEIYSITDEVGEMIYKYLQAGILPDVVKAARLN